LNQSSESFESIELVEIDSATEESPNFKLLRLTDINDFKRNYKVSEMP